MQYNVLLSAAIALGLVSLGGVSDGAYAQVGGLTFSNYNPTTYELTLTNARGIATINAAIGPQTSANNGTVNAPNFVHIDSPNSNPGGVLCQAVCAFAYHDSNIAYTISGFDSSGTPFTTPSQDFDLVLLPNGSNGGSLSIPAGGGLIYAANATSNPFPVGFNFNAPPAPAPAPAPTPAPVPSSINVPELNATRLTLPEPTIQPGNLAAQNNPTANTAPGDRVFRPNGIHTRIIPEWSPGLYQ